jgi:hypothetical protein
VRYLNTRHILHEGIDLHFDLHWRSPAKFWGELREVSQRDVDAESGGCFISK